MLGNNNQAHQEFIYQPQEYHQPEYQPQTPEGSHSQPFTFESERATAAGRRPKLSLASLIGQAILETPGQKARLGTIYEWIAEHYSEYYKLGQGGWQNSIRHNLTINKAFAKLPKDQNDKGAGGKGCFWIIHPDHLNEFKDGVFTGKIRSTEYRNRVKAARARKTFSVPDLPSYSLGSDNDSKTTISSATNLAESQDKALVQIYLQSQELSMSTPSFFVSNSLEAGPDPISISSSFNASAAQYPPSIQTFHGRDAPSFASSSIPMFSYGTGGFPGLSQPMMFSYMYHSQEFGSHEAGCACSLCVTLPAVSISPNAENFQPIGMEKVTEEFQEAFQEEKNEKDELFASKD